MYARFLAFPDLYLTAIQPAPFAEAVTVRFREQPAGSLQEAQLYIEQFNGVKPAGPGSKFPYGFAVESDRG